MEESSIVLLTLNFKGQGGREKIQARGGGDKKRLLKITILYSKTPLPLTEKSDNVKKQDKKDQTMKSPGLVESPSLPNPLIRPIKGNVFG